MEALSPPGNAVGATVRTPVPLAGGRYQVVAALYRRAIREVTRVFITTTLVPLVLPVFMLVIFSRVFAAVVTIHGFRGSAGYATYLVPAVILMAVMLGSPTAGISTAVELQTGFFDRVQISPVGTAPNLTARRLADATRLGLFAVVLMIVARLDGVAVANWPLALFLAIALGAWWGVAYGGIALAVCLRSGSAETAQALVPLFFPILFMSTAFMPMALLPGWLQAIAHVNPVSHLCDGIRAALAGRWDGRALAEGAAGTAVLTLATQTLVWVAQKARRFA